MVVGGYFDIHPRRYGEEKIHSTVKLNEERENFEWKLGDRAIKTEMPFFGICNGMQLINVLHGGKIIQHLPDDERFMDHEQSHVEGFGDYKTAYHEVEIVKNSKLFSLVGAEKIKTNSSHHQATSKAGQGLIASAFASDGVIEAVEKTSHPFCLGVQWHPEFESSDADKKIFAAFVAATKNYQNLK
jgi:putative glutamine amidotransferase